MQKDRELRFSSMREMAEAIEAVGTGAAAVAVVTENIARPSTGEMAFTGGRTTTPGTMPPMPPIGAVHEEPQRSNKGVIFGIIGGIALVAAGIGAFIAFGTEEGQTTADANADEQAAVGKAPDSNTPPPVDEVEEPVKAKELAADIETVNYTITTLDPDGNPVDADIVDPNDGGSYGKTNTAEGVKVEKSDQAMNLELRAKGFEPMPIQIIPRADKAFSYELVPVKKAATPTTTPTKKTPTKTTPKKTTPEPTPEPPPPDKEDTKKGPRRVSPDLKDPFGGRGR
jgi:serine/threonine-protein kinase